MVIIACVVSYLLVFGSSCAAVTSEITDAVPAVACQGCDRYVVCDCVSDSRVCLGNGSCVSVSRHGTGQLVLP
jgi:hypothetical protein